MSKWAHMAQSKTIENFGRETMNDLEKLKRAEESEPMAVAVFPMPETCRECPCMDEEWESCRVTGKERWYAWEGRADYCPLQSAIGIIEPNGHVVYLREEENEQDNSD